MIYVQPVTQAAAKVFVAAHHRHHAPPLGSIFQVGIGDMDRHLVGVAIVGRPVSRHLDDGATLEVTRVCVLPGVPNGCSMLYGACARAAEALGYARIYTYTLPSEGGASLRASGWIEDGEAGGGRMGAALERADPVRGAVRRAEHRAKNTLVQAPQSPMISPPSKIFAIAVDAVCERAISMV